MCFYGLHVWGFELCQVLCSLFWDGMWDAASLWVLGSPSLSRLRDMARGFGFTSSSCSPETSWETVTHHAGSKIFLTQPLQAADGAQLFPKAALT